MNQLPKTDVVIVGLGAAGGIAAHVLSEAGRKVVGLEAGPRLTNEDFLTHYDELEGYGFKNWTGEPKANKEVPTWRTSASEPTQAPPFAIKMMNAVGGTSIHYTTQSWRFREDDFKIRTTTIDRYGEAALPAGSAVADWPLGYDDLEPYYDQVEYLIGVAGQGGANPFEAPRKRDYPMPPLRRTDFTERAAEGMRSLGYHPFPGPAAIASQEYNGRPACTYCGYCTGFGCWNNAKSSTLVSAIAAAEESGNLEIRPNSRVTKLLSNDNGRVTGVEYLDADGQTVEQPAGVVILATYVYENVRLLLLSTSATYPDGLANNGGQVGKYYMSHAYPGATGLFAGERLNRLSGTFAQCTSMDDLNGDNFDHTGLGFIRGGIVSSGMGEATPIGASRLIPPGTPGWGSAYKRWLHDNAQAVGGIGAQLEVLPYEANFLDLDPEATDDLGMPVVRVTFDLMDNEREAGAYIIAKLEEVLTAMGASEVWSAPVSPLAINSHAYGGTRMGDDPASSVVDKYGLAHEAPNLAILGASTFPSTTGYNPTETLQAHAWYAAEHIAQNLDSIAV